MRKRSKRIALLLVALHENSQYVQVQAFGASGLSGIFVDVSTSLRAHTGGRNARSPRTALASWLLDCPRTVPF